MRLWGFLIILVTSLFTLYPTFHLALFGDDWFVLWNYLHNFNPSSSRQPHLISYFVDTYGPQNLIMGTLYNIFGLESTKYYVISYLFRLIAAISLWLPVFYLTRSKLASFFACLFFSVTTIGLETTNWVFNMPSYLAIASFNSFLYFFLKSRENEKIKLYILAGLFFYLAHVFAPIRMTGLLLFTIIIELFWIFNHRNIGAVKLSTLRLAFFSAIFVLIINTTRVPTTIPSSILQITKSILGEGLGTIQQLLIRVALIFYFIQ